MHPFQKALNFRLLEIYFNAAGQFSESKPAENRLDQPRNNETGDDENQAQRVSDRSGQFHICESLARPGGCVQEFDRLRLHDRFDKAFGRQIIVSLDVVEDQSRRDECESLPRVDANDSSAEQDALAIGQLSNGGCPGVLRRILSEGLCHRRRSCSVHVCYSFRLTLYEDRAMFLPMPKPKRTVILFLLTLVAPAAGAAETGLYDLLNDAHPIPFKDAVGGTTIRSTSNNNQRYYLALRATTNFSLPCTQIGLIIGSKTIRFNSQGVGAGGYTSMETIIEDPELIPEIAKYFHASVEKRHHPGHHMLVQFTPDKKRFSPGDPVTVTFRLQNAGDTDFTFWNGGRTRMATRNNQFSFTAEVWSKVVPDTGNPEHMGGLSVPVTLAPGETFEIKSVDLTKWFRFGEKGWYEIRGSYYMRFGLPDETGWEDFATAEFEVVVE